MVVGGAAFVLMSSGVWIWMSSDGPEEAEVSRSAETASFDPYAPTGEDAVARRVEEREVKASEPAPRARAAEDVITESERPPEDLSEWETEREKARVGSQRTVDDLPPDIRAVVLDDLPPRGVYEPRLSLDKLRKARRANPVQRKMLSKMAWERTLPAEKIDLLKAGNKRSLKAVDTTKDER